MSIRVRLELPDFKFGKVLDLRMGRELVPEISPVGSGQQNPSTGTKKAAQMLKQLASVRYMFDNLAGGYQVELSGSCRVQFECVAWQNPDAFPVFKISNRRLQVLAAKIVCNHAGTRSFQASREGRVARRDLQYPFGIQRACQIEGQQRAQPAIGGIGRRCGASKIPALWIGRSRLRTKRSNNRQTAAAHFLKREGIWKMLRVALRNGGQLLPCS